MKTPRTDQFADQWDCVNFPNDAMDFARQLETENAQLRETLAELVKYIDSDSINDYPPSVWGAYPPEVMSNARAILNQNLVTEP